MYMAGSHLKSGIPHSSTNCSNLHGYQKAEKWLGGGGNAIKMEKNNGKGQMWGKRKRKFRFTRI